MLVRSCPVAMALSIAALSGTTHAQTITSGQTSFTLGTVPVSGTATTAPNADLRVSGPAGLDHLASTWWWYRGSAQTREFAINSPTSTSFVGDTAILNFFVADLNFTATLIYRVFDLNGPNTGLLLESMTIFNQSATSNLSLDLSLLRDIDLAGTATSDTVTNDGQGLGTNILQITDGNWRDYSEGTQRYDVQTPTGVLNRLIDPLVDTFSPAVIPNTAGSYQHGFQWTLNLLPFSAGTVTASETITLIPSPGATVVLGAGMLALAGRRRR